MVELSGGETEEAPVAGIQPYLLPKVTEDHLAGEGDVIDHLDEDKIGLGAIPLAQLVFGEYGLLVGIAYKVVLVRKVTDSFHFHDGADGSADAAVVGWAFLVVRPIDDELVARTQLTGVLHPTDIGLVNAVGLGVVLYDVILPLVLQNGVGEETGVVLRHDAELEEAVVTDVGEGVVLQRVTHHAAHVAQIDVFRRTRQTLWEECTDANQNCR